MTFDRFKPGHAQRGWVCDSIFVERLRRSPKCEEASLHDYPRAPLETSQSLRDSRAQFHGIRLCRISRMNIHWTSALGEGA